VGTGLAYILNTHIVRQAGATVASTVTYLVPLFSTVLGMTLLGERLTWNVPLGGLLVLSGIASSQETLGIPLGRLRPRRNRVQASTLLGSNGSAAFAGASCPGDALEIGVHVVQRHCLGGVRLTATRS
jgi:hypothetical protein